MNCVCLVRPAPGWDKLRFDLQTAAVMVPPDVPVGLSAFGDGTWILHPADRAALDAAAALPGMQITAITPGGAPLEAAEAALREAQARGATRAIALPGAPDDDVPATARLLAAAVRRLAAEAPVDLLVAGATTPAGTPDELGPMVAELLGWGHGTAAGLDVAAGAAPAVVSIAPGAAGGAAPRYPQPAAILAAFREQAVESWSAGDLGPAGPPRPRSVVVHRAVLGEAPAVEHLADSIEESVAVLLQGLRSRGLLER